jgi:hypothetical protein
MKPARAVCIAIGGCQSMSCLSAATGPASGLGTTANPSRIEGENDLENEPTYTTRPPVSRPWRGSSGRST